MFWAVFVFLVGMSESARGLDGQLLLACNGAWEQDTTRDGGDHALGTSILSRLDNGTSPR